MMKIATAKASITDIESKIAPYVSLFCPVAQRSGFLALLTEDDLKVAEQECLKWQIEWKRRKRGAYDVINKICETMDMNDKVFAAEKVGIDTDEDYDIVCPV